VSPCPIADQHPGQNTGSKIRWLGAVLTSNQFSKVTRRRKTWALDPSGTGVTVPPSFFLDFFGFGYSQKANGQWSYGSIRCAGFFFCIRGRKAPLTLRATWSRSEKKKRKKDDRTRGIWSKICFDLVAAQVNQKLNFHTIYKNLTQACDGIATESRRNHCRKWDTARLAFFCFLFPPFSELLTNPNLLTKKKCKLG